MPDGNGVVVCEKLRRDKRTKDIPIILMSGVHKGTIDQIEGIERGADDYLSKPFSPGLLTAKLRAVLRRAGQAAGIDDEPPIKAGGFTVDFKSRTVKKTGGRVLALTRKEFDLLAAFLTKPSRVMSASYLLETVWGYDLATYNDPHTVGVHVSSLRKKLGAKLGNKIVSVPGLGYRYDP
jgi:DNA-binding response OmpR family regulator